MRKKRHAEHVNHERWLVSYADFITLLFAFFVVMFAVSQVDSKKVGRFSESFSAAVGIKIMPNTGSGIMPVPNPAPDSDETPEETKVVDTNELQKDLVDRLQAEGESQGIDVIEGDGTITLRLSEGVAFASGDDTLKDDARKALRTIAEELGPRGVELRVEGHTDDRPVRSGRFRSNWDLSTSRATAVIYELSKTTSIVPGKLSAAGYGEFHPVADNVTAEGRTKNRRVDIVVAIPKRAKAAPSHAAPRSSAPASAPTPADTGAAAPAHEVQEHSP